MLFALQFVGAAGVPLKTTVLVSCVVPKLAPEIVTDVPTGPDVGERAVIAGAAGGAGSGGELVEDLKAAISAIQELAGERVQEAAIEPAEV